MMIKNFLKNLAIWAIAGLVLGIVFFRLNFNITPTGAVARLAINFEDGRSRKFEGAVMPGMTILEALYSSSLGGNFELRYAIQKDDNLALAKLDGQTGPGSKNWHFYLNNKLVNTADINKIKIKAGDLIEAKYE